MTHGAAIGSPHGYRSVLISASPRGGSQRGEKLAEKPLMEPVWSNSLIVERMSMGDFVGCGG
jgi:hypothetical protein